MKAVVFSETGSARTVVSVRDIETPVPGPREVLVRMKARPIQPSDFMFVEGRYRIAPTFPQVAGMEGSGTIVKVGPEATSSIGRCVAFRSPGTWAEFVCVPEERMYIVPDGISFEAAAQFALNPVAAWALLDQLQVKGGDWIAINAATSSIAQLVDGLAQRRQAHVVGIVASDRKVPAGMRTVRDEPNLRDHLLEISQGAHFAGLLDSLGGRAVAEVLPVLKQGATIVSFAVLTNEALSMSNADIVYRNLCWKGFGIDYWLSTSAGRLPVMTRELWDALASRDISLPVRKAYRLNDVHLALDDAAGGGPGKVLIVD